MYAWYFPKGFWDGSPFWRHDWASAVVWINNPALDNPKVLGLSFSKSNTKYKKEIPANLVNGTTPVLKHHLPGLSSAILISFSKTTGESQDFIMWS